MGPLAVGKASIPRPKLRIKDCLIDGSLSLREVEGVLSSTEHHGVLAAQLTVSSNEDILAWCPLSNGEFTISSALWELSFRGPSMYSRG